MNRQERPKRIVFGVRQPEALGELLHGISSYVKQRQRNWLIECLDADEFMSTLKPGCADGVISVVTREAKARLSRIRRAGAAVVNLFHDCHPVVPSVLSDDHKIGAQGAEYLMRLGFRHFAFVGIRTGWSIQRQRGFAATIEQGGHRCYPSSTCESVADYHFMETAPAIRQLRRWLASIHRPVAIMACSDLVARSLLTACEGAKLRIPEDVAILGVDNRVALCELAKVPLSSIKQDFSRIGYEAAGVLDRSFSQRKSTPISVLVPPLAVVARRSTDIMAFENEHIASAMRLIHERASDGISIKELLRLIPVSRKWLDTQFKLTVGTTPSKQIHQLRVAHIRDLLLHTDLSVRQIAQQCNFSNSENLIRFFRDAEGFPPQQFRERKRT